MTDDLERRHRSGLMDHRAAGGSTPALDDPKALEERSTTGDGTLAEFASPLAAMRCAVDMQDHLASGSGSGYGSGSTLVT
jgi:hypothetical protein